MSTTRGWAGSSQKTLLVHFAELLHLCNFPIISRSLGFTLWSSGQNAVSLVVPRCHPCGQVVEGWREREGNWQPSSPYFSDHSSINWRGKLPSLIVLALVELWPLWYWLLWDYGVQENGETENRGMGTSESFLSFRSFLFWARSRELLLELCLLTLMLTSMFQTALSSGQGYQIGKKW